MAFHILARSLARVCAYRIAASAMVDADAGLVLGSVTKDVGAVDAVGAVIPGLVVRHE